MKIKNDNSSFIWIKENNYHSSHPLVEDLVETSAYTINFNLMPIRGIRFLLSVIIFLTFASLLGNFARLYLPDFPLRDLFANYFDVNGELNTPALYSTSVLLSCSALLAIIGSVKRVQRDRYRFQWVGLSFVFLYLGIDELTSIHESFNPIVSSVMKTGGFFYYSWVIPGFVFASICLLAFWKFLTHLPKKIRFLFLLAGSIYISGAIGLEMIGGYIADVYGAGHILWYLEIALEEFCEMLGIAIFGYALTTYISQEIEGVTCIVNISQDH
jgi:hypothetical protein